MPSNYGIKLGTRVLMGIPTLSDSRRSAPWTDAMTGLQMPLGSSLGRVWIFDETIAEARNALCKAALDQDAEYLFMLSDDVLPPANALLTLLNRVGKNYTVGPSEIYPEVQDVRCSMASGVYWTKTYPPEPYLFNGLLKGTYKDWKVGELHDIDMAGCDCLLIETEMLRQIPFPWFSTDWVWEKGQKVSSIATEDFYFYTKALQHGYRLFVDTSIQCAHEDRATGAMFGLTTDMVQAGGTPEVGDGEVLIADVGAGLATHSSLFGPNAKIVRFDMRKDVKPDVVCDVRALPETHFGLYDWVNASHILEHFRRGEAPGLLSHWLQLLKVGGKVTLHVPNFTHAVQIIMGDEGYSSEDKSYAWQQVYGDQARAGAPWQHLNGFTKRKLESLLKSNTLLSDIEVVEEDDGLNLKGTAVKTSPGTPEALSDMWQDILPVPHSNGKVVVGEEVGESVKSI